MKIAGWIERMYPGLRVTLAIGDANRPVSFFVPEDGAEEFAGGLEVVAAQVRRLASGAAPSVMSARTRLGFPPGRGADV